MTDILFDENNDLAIAAGDWQIGDSTNQEVEDLLISYPGWWKEFPLCGCALPNYLKSPGNGQAIQSTIQLQMLADGKQTQNYSYVNSKTY